MNKIHANPLNLDCWRFNPQADVVGYMYDIRNEGDYKEHRLAPLPRAIATYSDRTPGVDFNDSHVLRRRYGWAPYQVWLVVTSSC